MHDVDYVIMSAPPKDPDVTPTFIYGVNHEEYKGQKIVSASSCTTNCMGPMMKVRCLTLRGAKRRALLVILN